MAEQDELDRTESPSQKRLDDARKRGQVARSRDLSAAATTLAGGIGLVLMGGPMGARLMAMMSAPLQFSRAQATDPALMLPVLRDAVAGATQAMAPLIGLLMLAGVLAPLLIGGWTFSTSAFGMQWDRLDPVAGFGRVFSLRGLIEVGKSLLRISVVAVVAVIVLRNHFGEYTALGAEATRSGMAHAVSLTGQAFIWFGVALALIAVVDVPLTLWQHNKSLRMSRQELRDEARESEGNPEVRGRLRRLAQEMSKRRMMSDVPKAHVIVTNPTHYAVALRYEGERMRAPVVVAKGADLIALQIRKVGAAHQVPIVEVPPLARALYANCEIGVEVPVKLYAAVAQLLSYVYQLKAAVGSGRPVPATPVINVD
jgi:flagellar biosynthetic protein FlhB